VLQEHAMQEIERKFLVKNDTYKAQASCHKRITQGYLNFHPERTVRVRIMGDQSFLTIKGKSNKTGTTRFEWEKEIPLFEAQRLLELCEKPIIDKIRYNVPVANHVFEVDVFTADNEGLVIAEVELNREKQPFTSPNWLGKEVTGEAKYYNSQLSKKPYKQW
jgi:CYTH domain-containing protein